MRLDRYWIVRCLRLDALGGLHADLCSPLDRGSEGVGRCGGEDERVDARCMAQGVDYECVIVRRASRVCVLHPLLRRLSAILIVQRRGRFTSISTSPK